MAWVFGGCTRKTSDLGAKKPRRAQLPRPGALGAAPAYARECAELQRISVRLPRRRFCSRVGNASRFRVFYTKVLRDAELYRKGIAQASLGCRTLAESPDSFR